MDARTPKNRSSRRAAASRRGSGATRQSRSGRSTGVAIGVAVVVVVLIVAFVVVRAGLGRLFGGSRAATPAAAASASVPAQATAGTTGSATTATKPAKAIASTASTQAVPAGLTPEAVAWRTVDPSWMDKYRGKIVDGFKTEPGYKAVALTFDDGPNGETKYVIDTLGKYGGQATFFDTGRKLAMSWAKTQPAIIWKAGFELGNHTQHHTLPDGISSMWHRSYATDLAEINGPDAFAKYGTGRNTIWLRPMGGMIDKTGVKAAVDTNHLVINWTIDSNDSHGGTKTSDYIYNQVVGGIKSGDVVLLHVTHPESMAALPRIAKTLNDRGFKMVTLTELAQHSTAAITQHIPN